MSTNYPYKFKTGEVIVERPEICNTIKLRDTSTTCIHCGFDMTPEHAHYRCHNCGERDACCEGVY